MSTVNVKKTIFFWACILVLGALLQKLLPLDGISTSEGFAVSVGIVYFLFRGSCVIIHDICVWILKKRGQGGAAA